MNGLELIVKPHPTCKTGFTLFHNQPIGWRGTTQDHVGWFRSKKAAESSRTIIMNSNNMYFVESLLEDPESEVAVEEQPGDMVLF